MEKEINISPVKFKIKLRRQRYDGMNRWKFNFDGEERLATHQWVEFYAMTVEDGMLKIRTSELESLQIEANYN